MYFGEVLKSMRVTFLDKCLFLKIKISWNSEFIEVHFPCTK